MPKLDPVPKQGRIPRYGKLKKDVERLLSGPSPSDAVIALTDVYTGGNDFRDAEDAKTKMLEWVGLPLDKFRPHAAQFEFEAWLLPYWPDIQKLTGHNKNAPQGAGSPEKVNHNKPPHKHIEEMFLKGTGKKKSYVKTRDAARILDKNDLLVAITACPELKAFVNTILTFCKENPIP